MPDESRRLFFSKTYEYLESYLPGQVGRSPHTVESYRDALAVFRRCAAEVLGKGVRELEFGDVGRDCLLGFLGHMRSAGLSAGTCNQRLAAVGAYIWYAADSNVALQSLAPAASSIPPAKGPVGVGETLSRGALAALLAAAVGLDENSVEIINEAALLHDVGKIGVSESILNKQGPLTDAEYEEMKKHVDHSVGIIRYLPSLDFVIPAVIGHHERYDGTGYPRRVAGEDIPLSARILCVADSFDAMTSDRVYKKAYSVEHALSMMEKQAGRQFDPRLVTVFVDLVRKGEIVLQNA